MSDNQTLMHVETNSKNFGKPIALDVDTITSRADVENACSYVRKTFGTHHAAPPMKASISKLPTTMSVPSSVRIVEVGPRDGLQNEGTIVDASVKVALVHDLVDAGLTSIEVTGFVSPKWVPQLADASAVMSSIEQKPGVEYSVLVPNMKGVQAAFAAGAKHIAVFASATESFSRHNINCSIQDSLNRFRTVVPLALARGIKVRAYVSCVVGCPYEGYVSPETVAQVARELYDMGCYEISLGDTIGVGNPRSIAHVVDVVLAHGIPVSALAIHCHDTRGAALANVLAALSRGVSVVDASVGGLGGCPFAPGAPGNLATEDLVYMLQGMGIDIGPVILEKLIQLGQRMNKYLNRIPTSKVAIASRCTANGRQRELHEAKI